VSVLQVMGRNTLLMNEIMTIEVIAELNIPKHDSGQDSGRQILYLAYSNSLESCWSFIDNSLFDKDPEAA